MVRQSGNEGRQLASFSAVTRSLETSDHSIMNRSPFFLPPDYRKALKILAERRYMKAARRHIFPDYIFGVARDALDYWRFAWDGYFWTQLGRRSSKL